MVYRCVGVSVYCQPTEAKCKGSGTNTYGALQLASCWCGRDASACLPLPGLLVCSPPSSSPSPCLSPHCCRARRPFHPQRLHAFLTKHFLLQEPGWGQAGGPKQDNLAHSHHENCSGHHHPHSPAGAGSVHQTLLQASEQSQQAAAALQSMVQEVVGSEGATRSVQEQALLATVAAAASAAAAAASAAGLLLSQQQHGVGGAGAGVAAGPAHRDCDEQGAASSAEPQQRQQLLTDSYGHLLRSKGFVWLASRPNLCGEWTQVGAVASLRQQTFPPAHPLPCTSESCPGGTCSECQAPGNTVSSSHILVCSSPPSPALCAGGRHPTPGCGWPLVRRPAH
jgi:hypothetical protein